MLMPSHDFFQCYGRDVADDWTLTPTSYRIPIVGRSVDDAGLAPTIDYTGRGWAVHHGNFRLSKESKLFCLASLASNRTEEYILDTVFATPEDALAFFRQHWVPQSEEHPHCYWVRRWHEKWVAELDKNTTEEPATT